MDRCVSGLILNKKAEFRKHYIFIQDTVENENYKGTCAVQSDALSNQVLFSHI